MYLVFWQVRSLDFWLSLSLTAENNWIVDETRTLIIPLQMYILVEGEARELGNLDLELNLNILREALENISSTFWMD